MSSSAPPKSATKVAKATTGEVILPDTTISSNNNPVKVKSNSPYMYSSPTPSKKSNATTTKIGSSQRKKTLYPFRGNVRSPAPKVDNILINHLVSPEQLSHTGIKEEKNGADATSDIGRSAKKNIGLNFKALENKFNFKNPQERKKIYNRLYYLKQIQLNHPEEFVDLCKVHDVQVDTASKNGETGKVLYEYYLAPETVASALLSTTNVELNTDEDNENVAPLQKPKVLFMDEDNTVATKAVAEAGLKADIGSEEDDVNDKAAEERPATPTSKANQTNGADKDGTATSTTEDSISIDELNAMLQGLFSNMIRYHTNDLRRDVDELKQKEESI